MELDATKQPKTSCPESKQETELKISLLELWQAGADIKEFRTAWSWKKRRQRKEWVVGIESIRLATQHNWLVFLKSLGTGKLPYVPMSAHH